MAQTDRNGATTDPAAPPTSLVWRGAWVASVTTYETYDLAYVSGSTYICLISHTASAVFATDLGLMRWAIFAQQGLSGSGAGDMLGSNNLAELTNLSAARTTLGVAVGTDVQPYDVQTAKKNGANTWTGVQTFVDSLLEVVDNLDLSKKLTFQLAGITAAVSRLWTIGNYSGVPAVPPNEGVLGQLLSSAGPGGQPSWVTPSSSSVKIVTDTADITLAAAAAATQSSVGASFSTTIPASGIIKLSSFAGRLLNNATTGARTISFGIRIGSTNYWFGQGLEQGVFNIRSQIQPATVANGVAEVNGSPISMFNTSLVSDFALPVIDIVALSVPTGVQTVQFIAGYQGLQTSLKGTVKTTRVILEFVS